MKTKKRKKRELYKDIPKPIKDAVWHDFYKMTHNTVKNIADKHGLSYGLTDRIINEHKP